MKNISGSKPTMCAVPETYNELSKCLFDLKETTQIKSGNEGKGTAIYLVIKHSEKNSVKEFIKKYLTTSGRKIEAMNRQITHDKVVSILAEKFERNIVLTHIKSVGICDSKIITAGLLRNAIENLETQGSKSIVDNITPKNIPARRVSLT